MIRSFRFIEKCPKPVRDTGCTFCKMPMEQPIKQDNLNNTCVTPWKHVLILSHGYSKIGQLPSNIYKPEGIASQLRKMHLGTSQGSHPVLFSHIFPYNFKEDIPEDTHLVYMYPNNIRIQFKTKHLKEFHDYYLSPPITSPVSNPFDTTSSNSSQKTTASIIDSSIFQETKLRHPLYMACGHGSRDERCGKSAPYILREFETICNPNERLAYVSHIGGHAYAGNVIIYPENIWYGRVSPEKVQGIYNSYHNKEIIKEHYRGRV